MSFKTILRATAAAAGLIALVAPAETGIEPVDEIELAALLRGDVR